MLGENVTVFPSSDLDLCTEYLPCALILKGGLGSTLEIFGSVHISCLATAGCLQISVHSVAIACIGSTMSVFTAQGSALIISKVSFTSCWSNTDGGAVRAYDMAQVVIQESNFTDIHSRGFGGAVSVLGSNLSISKSLFQNCSSPNGGGAIWSSGIPDCFRTNQSSSSYLRIESSEFTNCSSGGVGGGLFADSSRSANLEGGGALDVYIISTNFFRCSSSRAGAALRISGALVSARISESLFASCSCGASGGAISSSDFSSLSLVACELKNSTALGAGGGAVHLNFSFFSAYNVNITKNAAPQGGGGAIFWQGWVMPATIHCPKNTIDMTASCSPLTSGPFLCRMRTCENLNPGKVWVNYSLEAGDSLDVRVRLPRSPDRGNRSHSIQAAYAFGGASCLHVNCSNTSRRCSSGQYRSVSHLGVTKCTYCIAGTYSEWSGSLSCSECERVTFSWATGADSFRSCSRCPPGRYSTVEGATSSSICALCVSGTYSSLFAATVCSKCPAGTFSQVVGSNGIVACRRCPAGKYSSVEGATSVSVCSSDTAGMGHYDPDSSGCSNCSTLALNQMEGVHILNANFAYRSTTPSSQPITYTSRKGKAHILSCTKEQILLLESLTSVSLSSVNDFTRFLSMLMLQTQTSSPQKAVEYVLSGMNVPSSTFLRKDKYEYIERRHLFPQKSKTTLHPRTKINRNIISKSQYLAAEYATAPTPRANGINKSEILSNLCGPENYALYGDCIASDFHTLLASRHIRPAYSGLQFEFTVLKKDAYNNTIISDSSSLVQAMPLLATGEADPSTSIMGSSVSKMSAGVATFALSVKATVIISNIHVNQSAAVQHSIFLRVEGVDSESGENMRSGLLPVDIQQGANVCPLGYVLTVDKEGEANSPAICTFCKQGTYSLSPWAGAPGSSRDSPACLNCPIGLNCNGGADVNQKENSTWFDVDGVYHLISCPPGFQLINSTSGTSRGEFASDLQQCRECSVGQYIINPNTDECQECPPGIVEFRYRSKFRHNTNDFYD